MRYAKGREPPRCSRCPAMHFDGADLQEDLAYV